MKIFNFVISFSFLLVTFIGFSQDLISGKIYYCFTENKSEFTEKRHEFFDKIQEQASGVKFILKFSNNSSIFEIESNLENDTSPFAQSFASRIVANGRYYTNLEENKTIRQTDAYGEKINIFLDKTEQKWELSNESKLIGKYKVYKATKKKTVVNSEGTFDFKVIAWYCPEIPSAFGPKDYNSLPGIILELKDTHYTFYALKIEILNKNGIEIMPFKGKFLKEKEYKEKIKKIKPYFLD